jgi:hypothetical protein
VYWRPVGLPLFRSRRRRGGKALGRARTYTDEELKEGTRLALEVFLPDETSVTCKVQVVSVEKLAEGAPALFDMEIEFIALRPGDRERLAPVLVEDVKPDE